MRLAVSIAAWSHDPDATLPPEYTMLPSALQALGFSVMHASLDELPAGLSAALAGVEEQDTLLVHVSGVLRDDGALELDGQEPMPLSGIADALAARPPRRALVVVEAAYRGAEDALRAVEHVEAVADALSSQGGSHTTVIAVHPVSTDAAKLAFTRLVLDSVRDVVNGEGVALIDDAYARARERQMGGIAASAFAFFRGDTPFHVAHGLPAAPAPAPVITEPAVATPRPAALPADRESTRTLDITHIASSRPGARTAVAAPAARVTQREFPSAPASEPPVPPSDRGDANAAVLGDTAASPVWASTASPNAPPPVVTDRDLPVSSPEVEPPVAEGPAPSAVVSEPSGLAPASSPPVKDELDARIAEALEAGNHRLAVELRRARIPRLPTIEARVDELFEIGRTQVGKLRDLPEAVLTLEEARGIDASRSDVLEALRRAYGRLSRWTETLEVTLSLVKQTPDPRERAGLRVAAATLAREHLADEDYALELLELALDDDPSDEAALEQVSRVRRGRGELAELAKLLAKVADRLVESGDAARAWDACQRLAALRRDDLRDPVGAVEALAVAKRLPLSELDSRAVLAEQLLALDDDEGAIVELDAIVAEAPEYVRAHARLFSIHNRRGNSDRAYLSALVLEELGDADASAREILEAYRSDWGLRAHTALDDRGWALLRARESDEVIEAVFRASLRAAISAQVEERGKPPPLDPARRQSETSTASIVRCFHWAARALGTPCPALYVLDDVAGGIAAVAVPEPTTALGPEVVRGLSSKTLAFLAGRHLTYFRPEHQALVHFPTAEAAAGLFFAAVDLVAPGTFVPTNLALRVATAKHRLARHLKPEELSALSAAVGRMEARDAKVDLLGWIRSVELTAGRAGLLLSGDLATALSQVRAEPRGLSGLSVEERRRDLLSFCASRAFVELRTRYADTTPSSMRPPTSESAVVRRDDIDRGARLLA